MRHRPGESKNAMILFEIFMHLICKPPGGCGRACHNGTLLGVPKCHYGIPLRRLIG